MNGKSLYEDRFSHNMACNRRHIALTQNTWLHRDGTRDSQNLCRIITKQAELRCNKLVDSSIIKVGFWLYFLPILNKNISCGYSLEVTHQLMLLWGNNKKYL